MTTTAPLPVPTSAPITQVPGIVAAVSGPFAWRLWWPVVAYLLAGSLAWISTTLTAVADGGTWVTWPSGIMVIATLIGVGMLWSQGAPFALSLGHHRGVTFVVTLVLGVAQAAVLHLVSLTVNLAEIAVLGQGGIHVFALETPPGKFGSHDGLLNGTWDLWFWYGLPLLLLMVMVVCAQLRWRLVGLFGGVTLAVALPLVALFGASRIPVGMSSAGALITLALVVALPVGLAWYAFRRVPV